MYQRGDIVLVPFPFTDQSATNIRPALIISNSIVNDTSDVIIVMITSQNKNDFFQIELTDENVAPSLPRISFVRCHRVATIDSGLILLTISKANDNLLKSVEDKIQSLTTKLAAESIVE